MKTNDVEAAVPSPLTRLSLSLPEGLSASVVAVRKAAILDAQPSLDHLRAEQFAIDAEMQQRWHDDRESRSGVGQLREKTDAEEIAATITAAQREEPSSPPDALPNESEASSEVGGA